MTRSLQAVTDHPKLFRAASPFWYITRSASRIDLRSDSDVYTVASALRGAGVGVVPTVIAPLSPEAMNDLLSDPSQRSTHVAALVNLVMDNGYDGIDLDYEHFAVTDDAELILSNRAGFNAFVTELCEQLAALNRLCVVTVMARTDDALQASYRPELGVGVFDYETLGAAVDRLRVMAYDHHYPSGSPGSVAGYHWVEDVIHYTVARVDPWKVELGVASYGYDWGSSGATSRTTEGMQAFASSLGVTPAWSSTEREMTFSYVSSGVRHTVWFEDARSLGERVKLAADHCLAGVSMWTTGGADSAMWDALEHLSDQPFGCDDGWRGTFFDDDDSIFEADIEWLAAQGITKGCNPPANTMYCPRDPVSREAMAAFLGRALGLTANTHPGFIDVPPDSTFANDIGKLATAGITKGCNPPHNDRFCPREAVDRGQMAALLVRALGLTDGGGGDLFVDDDGSIFENDIDKLGTAGVTRGCNPPTNDTVLPR